MGGQRVEDGRPPSNLQRFLDCTTPTVDTHILPKVTLPSPVNPAPAHAICATTILGSFRIRHYSSADLLASPVFLRYACLTWPLNYCSLLLHPHTGYAE